MFKYVWKYIKQKKLTFIFLGIVTIISAILSVVFPTLNGKFVDAIVVDYSMDSVFYYVYIIGGTGVVLAVFTYVNKLVLKKAINSMQFSMSSDLITHIQKIKMEYYSGNFNPAEILQRITTDTAVITEYWINNLFTIFSNAFICIVLIMILLQINMYIFILALLFIVLYLIVYKLLKKKIYFSNYVLKEKAAYFYKILFEQINQIYNIKVGTQYGEKKIKREREYIDFLKCFMKNMKISQLFEASDEILSLGFQLATLLLVGWQIIQGEMTIGGYIVINMYFTILMNIIKYYFNLGRGYQEAEASYNRILELNRLEEECNGKRYVKSIVEISAWNVNYEYINGKKVFTNDKSVKFLKGNIYIIKGKNGSGKTTFINMLLGILQNIQCGEVRYNGINISELDMYSIRRKNMAVLLQNNVWPDMTVKDYIEESTNKKVEEILIVLAMRHGKKLFVNEDFDIRQLFTKKLDTLSGGELQKIFLLQTLAEDSEILILDEPSGGLDYISVNNLAKYLRCNKHNKITILITHDDKYDKVADKIINF